jgi:hypothetical protein
MELVKLLPVVTKIPVEMPGTVVEIVLTVAGEIARLDEVDHALILE